MIIWGSTGREKVLARGQFYCPSCDAERNYKHIKLSRWFTLYFIPLFPTEKLAEYVQCQGCQGNFKPEVLEYEPPSQGERIVYSLRADLDSGTPVQMAQRKLTNAGMDPETAQKFVMLALGDASRTCPDCDLIFRETVTHCSGCGREL